MEQINKRIICIQGFTQTVGKPNGIHELYLRLRKYSSPDCEIVLQPWNANWDALAEFIFNTCDREKVDIRVFAYSWGCGNGFVQLQKALRKRGLPAIRYAVLCDPVYYRWGRWWRAMFSPVVTPTIDAGDTGEVWWLRQFENKPQGHQVIGKGIIHEPIVLNQTHQYMDDANEFYEMCSVVANGVDRLTDVERASLGKTSSDRETVPRVLQQELF